MAKLLRLFIIAFFLICIQSAADEIVADFEMGDLPFYLITASDARSVIIENIGPSGFRVGKNGILTGLKYCFRG